jgi:hypothetical protein
MKNEQYNDWKVAEALVKTMLAWGLKVSVNDGEETTLVDSTNCLTILRALNTSGEDTISAEGCWFYLVWGNGVNELICDYSANDVSEIIYRKALDRLIVSLPKPLEVH